MYEILASTASSYLQGRNLNLPDPLIVVASDLQSLVLYEKGRLVADYPVSTAVNGLGCEEGSYKTPTGLHRIESCIGAEAEPGAIFRGRELTGEHALISNADIDSGEDLITSRIMWLEGMESGVNMGKGIDSHDRYIYIHGTNEEGRIGKPVSHGCVRMKNADVIDLFDRVNAGTYVLIL